MKIVINGNNVGIGHQILDAWHAYRQSISDKYISAFEYTFENISTEPDHDLSIFCDYMPSELSDDLINSYDLVLICNGGEPLEVANPFIKHVLETHSNVYFIVNALLTDDHELKTRTIWFPDCIQTCRDYWTRHFYPQYYENTKLQNLPRQNLIHAITGSNRANRHYFFESLRSQVVDLPMHSKINTQLTELADCQWETVEDSNFREWLNDHYGVRGKEIDNENYYAQKIHVGIKEKFGSILPGYFILPLYFENHCIVFPDTSWINNQLCVTEKALKCFYSGSLPMPVSGANVNKLYNQIGFYTAWNLLPDQYKKFDSELDHQKRYLGLVEAIKWLWENPSVFKSQQFEQFTSQNKINFLTCKSDADAIQTFDNLINRCLN